MDSVTKRDWPFVSPRRRQNDHAERNTSTSNKDGLRSEDDGVVQYIDEVFFRSDTGRADE
jgi:hypothetical protein